MSYRVSKPKQKKPSFLRSTSSPFSSAPRRKPVQRSKTKPDPADKDDDLEERLEDLGLVETLETDLSLRDVPQSMDYIKSHMFDEIPEKSGMNSTRTAEVLNYRKNLPPIVTNAHIHALINSPTMVEKEIGQLVTANIVRRIVVPGRGTGASSISDALVIVKDWSKRLEESIISDDLKKKYTSLLYLPSQRWTKLQNSLSDEDINVLVQAGFVISASTFGASKSTVLSGPDKSLAGTATSIHNIARAASGSLEAIGGQGALQNAGGGGFAGLKAPANSDTKAANLKLSMPNTGSYLKLVEGARSHLLGLLSKSKYNEAPLYLLKERWNGGVSTKNPYGRSKDPFRLIVPAKTRKWKDFYGLNFDWVLAECLGGGLIEVFNTRSVGLGVRVV